MLQRLIRGKLSVEELTITCLLKRPQEYKTHTLIQLHTARKIFDRQGAEFDAGTRLPYVVVKGKEPFFKRGEDPVYARKKKMPLDYEYYLENQVLSAIHPLLSYYTGPNLQPIFKQIRGELKRNDLGVKSLASMFAKKSH
jgi:DNA polymerase elongation subunit (family B)